METSHYFSRAHSYAAANPKDFKFSIKINLITNFTDEVLKKFLIAACLEEGIYPDIFTVPYKQYDFFLAQKESALYTRQAESTFIFFDANTHADSSFTVSEGDHFSELSSSLEEFIKSQKGMVIANTFALPYQTPYGSMFIHSKMFKNIEVYNTKFRALENVYSNFHTFDINRLLHHVGEKNARNLRGLYAFDMPFSNEFLLLVAKEWFSYIRVLVGKIKKCIVVDLDNTIWGGVVGELGPKKIMLGKEYPGIAFKNFQRALLECYNRGILLAINSKNNQSDVDEVFDTNTEMILKKEHFAASRINWNIKSENIISIARELNIGLESMVFIDDDPVNRGLVREMLPEVLVPEWDMPPERYVDTLFSLPIYNQFALTEEDQMKGKMYTEEKKRKEIKSNAINFDDYVSTLGLRVSIHINNHEQISRLSQLSLKTNQFNLTTKRYSESAIEEFMRTGRVYAGDVYDKFGAYGVTILAIVRIEGKHAELDVFLMSCRIMGRSIEYALLNTIIEDLQKEGIERCNAVYIPTAKNIPAKEFLANSFYTETSRDNEGKIYYTADLNQIKKNTSKAITSIQVMVVE